MVRILDAQGNTVVKYAYDPWGVPTIEVDKDLAALNPCSYRGYYYDEETGYYYLQSRYYDPAIGRFINADEPVTLLLPCKKLEIENAFAYCNNCPTNDVDIAGYISLKSVINKIKEVFSKVQDYLWQYMNGLFVYNAGKKTLSIQTGLIAIAIDAICTIIMPHTAYFGLRIGMKALLKNNVIRRECVKALFDFFLNNFVGKIVLKKLVIIGFTIAGTKWHKKVKEAFISDLFADLACQKYRFLSGPVSLISAFSSFGGIVAFFFDLFDGRWDDYATIKLA